MLSNVYAQDQLITTSGDTINCKITQIYKEHLTFTLPIDRENERKIPLSSLTNYGSSEPVDEIVFSIPEGNNSSKIHQNKNKGLIVGFGVGYSYRFTKIGSNIPRAFRSYVKELKSGYTLKTEVAYFFGTYFGLGAKYAYSRADNKMENVIASTPQGIQVGTMEDHISIHYLGLHLTTRFGDDSYHILPGASFGYTFYEDKGQLVRPISINGGSFSMAAHLSADFRLIGNLFAVAGIDLVYAMLSEVQINDSYSTYRLSVSGKDRENLNRIELWGGLRYYIRSNPPLQEFYFD